MTVIAQPLSAADELGITGIRKPQGRPMYAIAFDIDIESLRSQYGDPYNNAYTEIRRILQEHGFKWQQGSVYFGGDEINAVTCVLAAQDLARRLPWFAASIRDIRMLRIEELNDLMPAVQQAIDHK
jgi:virulence-associated protein VapD